MLGLRWRRFWRGCRLVLVCDWGRRCYLLVGRLSFVCGRGQRIQGGIVGWNGEGLIGIDGFVERCLDIIGGRIVSDFGLVGEKQSEIDGAQIEEKRILGWTIPTVSVPRFVVSKAARCVRILRDFVNARRRNGDLQHSGTGHVFVGSPDSVSAGITVLRKSHLVASGTVTHNLSR